MARIQIRRDTAANWASNNPILFAGEIGHDITNGTYKMGNGVSTWNVLAAIQVYNNSSWSFSDDFNRANGVITGANYLTFLNYNVDERPTIISNQVYRPGIPAGADWQDGAIRLSDSKSLSHWAQMDIATMASNTETGFFDGPPAAALMVRATPVIPADGVNHYNANGDGTPWPHMPLALWAGIKSNIWGVWLGYPSGRTDSVSGTNRQFSRAARGVARGTGTFTSGGTFRFEVTGEDVATLKYKDATLWSGPVLGCPRGTYVGFSPGSGATRIDNFSGGLVT